jgi:hypothetical protein
VGGATGAWKRVRRVDKLADPSRGACRRMEAWTAADLCRSGLGASDLSFGGERGVGATPKWVEIAQIHRSVAKTPLLVVLLAKRGLGGDTIGSSRSCQRNWQRCRSEMGNRQKER